jgi:hypothetical protein
MMLNWFNYYSLETQFGARGCGIAGKGLCSTATPKSNSTEWRKTGPLLKNQGSRE